VEKGLSKGGWATRRRTDLRGVPARSAGVQTRRAYERRRSCWRRWSGRRPPPHARTRPRAVRRARRAGCGEGGQKGCRAGHLRYYSIFRVSPSLHPAALRSPCLGRRHLQFAPDQRLFHSAGLSLLFHRFLGPDLWCKGFFGFLCTGCTLFRLSNALTSVGEKAVRAAKHV